MTSRDIALSTVLVLVAFGLSCGGRERKKEPTDPGDTVRPSIVSALPDADATDLSLTVPITVTFSEAMDPATLTDATIVLTAQGSHSRVDYDAATLTATVTLDTLLTENLWYTLLVTEGATDAAGNAALTFSRSFQTGAFDCPHIADALEPNGSATSATTATIGGVRRSLSICGDDKDIYRLNIDAPSKIKVLTPIHDASADTSDYPGWQIHFMRENGDYYATLGTSARPGEFPSYEYSFLPGTYFVEIYSSYGLDPGEYVLYDLDVSASAPCEDDPYEDNDFRDGATPLTEGLHTDLKGCRVDLDNYSIAMTAGQTLSLTVDATVAGGESVHRRYGLIPPQGAPAGFDGTDNPVVLEVTSESDGQATIEVRFWADGVDYSMDLRYGE